MRRSGAFACVLLGVLLAACGGTARTGDGAGNVVFPDVGDPGTGEGTGPSDPGPDARLDAADPGASDPGTEESGTADPGGSDPGTADPGTADPGTADPGGSDPGTADPGATDPGTSDPGEDPGTTADEGGEIPAGGCDGCGTGTITGKTCAPSTQVVVAKVKVWVDAYDCHGQPVHIQTYSDDQGTFTLTDVPCGTQTVYMEKGSFKSQFTRWIDQGSVTKISSAESCFPPNAAKIAVITGDWDAIENTLDNLSLKYTKFGGLSGSTWEAEKLLKDSAKLNEFDILFINCSDSAKDVMGSSGATISANLIAFVQKGGSIYASDYASPYIGYTWPGAIDFGPQSVGGHTHIPGDVVDGDLAKYVGKSVVDIYYGLGPLTLVEGVAATSTIHIQGDIPGHGNDLPMMASFVPYTDGGRVAYTTFHNEEQVGIQMDMDAILNFVVFML